jgi:hypothetical protein
MLNGIKHPVGPGTPLDGDLTTNKGRMMACVTCHMGAIGPENHLFRINTDPNYTPFPTAAQFAAGQTTAITYDEDGYAAVGMSLDLSCGQCHGGGTDRTTNPPQAGVPYMDKYQLAAYATGMHGQSTSAPTAASTGLAINDYTVTFVDASTNSDHAAATDMKVTVNWGDGNVSSGVGGDTFSHTYTTAATFYVQHTVNLNNKFNTETIKAVVPSAVLGGGTVGVTVNDYNGAGLADVNLYLKQNGLTKKLGATDSTGTFTFADVPSGTYDLLAYKYGVLLSSDCGGTTAATPGNGVVTVNATTPNPTCTFTQTQTQFTLTVNGTVGFVVTVKQAGVTKGIQKIDADGSIDFGRLAAGTYTVDAYMSGYTCTQQTVVISGSNPAPVALICSAL